MRALVLLLLLILPLGACRGDRVERAPPTPAVSPASTRIPGSIELFDLNTLQRVYSVGGSGRIPLGLANRLLMRSANARLDSSVEGAAAPPWLGLSMIFTAPLPAMMFDHGRTFVAYEWWFSSTDPSDDAAKTDLQPQFKAALRFADESWVMYIDAGSGWQRLPGATFAFGEYELSARLPLDPSWSIAPPRSAYFRAVTRDDGFLANANAEGLGDVYPDDLSWRKVFEY